MERAVIGAVRFGYGLPSPAHATPGAMLAALAGPDLAAQRWPIPGIEALRPDLAALETLRLAQRRDEPGAIEAYRASFARVEAVFLTTVRHTLARALDAPDGFRERLVAFWSDHFTTRARSTPDRSLPSALAEDAIRPNLTGRFADLLRAAVLHPAMLVYLDQVGSVGPASGFGVRRRRGLNENLARELLELHTLGVGAGYDQRDVRELAEALTGLFYDHAGGFRFLPARAEPGAETILGATFGGDGAQLRDVGRVLDSLAAHPETARHICRKIAVHFVADAPDPDLLAALQAAWHDSDGRLDAVYAALLSHPAAWAPQAQKARQPIDWMLAALRALGVTGADLMAWPDKALRRRILAPLQAMGQPWQAPRGPDGWPEAATAWISPQGLAARIQWAMTVPAQIRDPLPDPRDFADHALGPLAGPALRLAVTRAESAREGVGLVLAAPEFNRR